MRAYFSLIEIIHSDLSSLRCALRTDDSSWISVWRLFSFIFFFFFSFCECVNLYVVLASQSSLHSSCITIQCSSISVCSIVPDFFFVSFRFFSISIFSCEHMLLHVWTQFTHIYGKMDDRDQSNFSNSTWTEVNCCFHDKHTYSNVSETVQFICECVACMQLCVHCAYAVFCGVWSSEEENAKENHIWTNRWNERKHVRSIPSSFASIFFFPFRYGQH